MGRVEGKAIIVTGAASGIGRETALVLAREGASVTVADRDPGGAEVAAAIGAAGGKAVFVRADATRDEDAERTVAQTLAAWGRLDALVNNAGTCATGRLHELDEAGWNRNMDVNLRSIYLHARHAIPVMLAQKKGAIVNISSLSGVAGDYGMAGYNAAKGGVTNLTRGMALDYAKDGIRVNAVCPGAILTPMLEANMREIGYEAARAKFDGAYPPGFIGEPADIAYAVLYLVSDEARFVNGINLLVDGGITAHTGQPRFGAS